MDKNKLIENLLDIQESCSEMIHTISDSILYNDFDEVVRDMLILQLKDMVKDTLRILNKLNLGG